MPNLFDTAHTFTARWEGGLTDHPADPGGLTKYGVSLRWVQDLAQQARQECLRQHRCCDGCSAARTPNCTYSGLQKALLGCPLLCCPPPAPGSGPVRWRGQYGASQSRTPVAAGHERRWRSSARPLPPHCRGRHLRPPHRRAGRSAGICQPPVVCRPTNPAPARCLLPDDERSGRLMEF